jgi:DNA primase
MTPLIDFDSINAAALLEARDFLQKLIPGGKFRSLEYVVKNPTRNDRETGSFSINYKSGRWKDFACGHGGSDIISLVAYIRGSSQGEAARELADRLGIPLYKVAITRTANGSAAKVEAKVHQWGDEGPPKWPDELRRHPYPNSTGQTVKIKKRDGGYAN